ncbi:MAG: GerMN domain-containing protein [Candidatus Gribaldobacteria bacterium]|nr:GerMN domain-containing protein [Candidatus Gribaldobacteria bacterium]
MKKVILIIIFGLFLVGIIFLAIRFLSGPEDSWLCQNGVWVKHGQPSEPMPSVICGPVIPENTATSTNPNTSSTQNGLSNTKGTIIVESLKPNQEVSLPFTIKGRSSTFEGNVLYTIKTKAGESLATGCFMGGSMGMAPFEKTITYLNEQPTSSNIILEVSDESAKDGSLDTVSIPLKLTDTKFTAIKLYFTPQEAGQDCQATKPLEVFVPKVSKIATLAMGLLLEGVPCGRSDIVSSINYGTKVQSLTIVDGVAKVDFNSKIEEGVGGACKVTAIRSQITETLKQFFAVTQVIISVNGKIEGILQP